MDKQGGGDSRLIRLTPTRNGYLVCRPRKFWSTTMPLHWAWLLMVFIGFLLLICSLNVFHTQTVHVSSFAARFALLLSIFVTSSVGLQILNIFSLFKLISGLLTFSIYLYSRTASTWSTRLNAINVGPSVLVGLSTVADNYWNRSFVSFSANQCSDKGQVNELLHKFGWNSGNKILDWLGTLLKEKYEDADITFQEVSIWYRQSEWINWFPNHFWYFRSVLNFSLVFQLYEKTGKELCIVVLNLNRMREEYFHPKTTPSTSIRRAVQMSISIPGNSYRLFLVYFIIFVILLVSVRTATSRVEQIYSRSYFFCKPNTFQQFLLPNF